MILLGPFLLRMFYGSTFVVNSSLGIEVFLPPLRVHSPKCIYCIWYFPHTKEMDFVLQPILSICRIKTECSTSSLGEFERTF